MAISTVPSLLPESRTMISSANATDAKQAAIFAASLRVMTMTLSRGKVGFKRSNF
jgi:hypothetical protein